MTPTEKALREALEEVVSWDAGYTHRWEDGTSVMMSNVVLEAIVEVMAAAPKAYRLAFIAWCKEP